MTVFWTDKSLENASSIKGYLEEKFSDKEIQRFYLLLATFEEAVSIFPELYPQSGKKRKIRRALLSEVLSVFYRISKNQIEVLAVLDNRTDLTKWMKR